MTTYCPFDTIRYNGTTKRHVIINPFDTAPCSAFQTAPSGIFSPPQDTTEQRRTWLRSLTFPFKFKIGDEIVDVDKKYRNKDTYKVLHRGLGKRCTGRRVTFEVKGEQLTKEPKLDENGDEYISLRGRNLTKAGLLTL